MYWIIILKTIKISFYFVFVTIITTNIALFVDPYIVRQSASASNFYPFQAKLFKLTGAASYGYAQAFVLLIPILVYYIKYQQKFIFFKKDFNIHSYFNIDNNY